MRPSRSGSPYTRWCVQDLKHKKDEALAEAAQAGDGAATEELLLRYKNAVLARARRYFLTGGETDDLVQEGMVGLYFAIRDYRKEEGKSFKNFAYLCVTRRIYDAVRTMSRRKNEVLNDSVSLFDPIITDLLDGGASPEDSIIDDESRAEFKMQLMKTLSDFEFRVFTMYLEGMSYAKICEATEKPIKSIDNALARAKKKLQQAYCKKG